MQPWKYWEDKSKPFPGRSRDWLRRYLLHAREPSVPPWLETREFPLHDQGLGWTSHGAYANLLISVSDRCGWPLGCSGFSGGAYWNFRCCFSQTLAFPAAFIPSSAPSVLQNPQPRAMSSILSSAAKKRILSDLKHLQEEPIPLAAAAPVLMTSVFGMGSLVPRWKPTSDLSQCPCISSLGSENSRNSENS